MSNVKKPVVLITGSSGNIGSAITQALKNDYDVVGFDMEGTKCDFTFDITSTASIELALKRFKESYGNKIATVIHLAAYFDFSGEESPLYEAVNVEGTKNLLQKLQNFEVEQFIYTSTMLVHQPCQPGEMINEDSSLNPKWIYPQSKLKTEKIIKKHHGDIPYLILRLAGLYNESSCVPTLSHQIARIYERRVKSHLYAGDLRAGQSFIHQDDLVDLFKKAVDKRQELPEEDIILAGESQAVSYQNLQEQITQLIHQEKAEIITVPSSIAKAGAWIEEKSEPIVPDDFDQGEKPFIRPFMIDMASDHYSLDISKAKKQLDWEPKNRIENTLPKIIQFLKKDPEQWYEKNGLTLPHWMQGIKDKNAEKIRASYEKQLKKQHQQNLWAHFLNLSLGFWLITSPMTLGYESYYNSISDIVSGSLLVIFSFLCLSWRMAIARLVCTTIGLWVIFAPLVFWVPTAAAYLNDTLIGSMIIGFSILVRPDIGVAPNAAMTGPVIPPGWDFSPSTWPQRLPIIILAFIGLFISRYLAAYQLGHIDNAWDPFFQGSTTDPKNGTEEIITSYVSEAWPVPDAGLGAVVYLLEILTGIIGGSNRWRTMPWLVLLFGFMIVPLGAVSITFIIIQPILLNTWCTLCLIGAVAMVLQIPYSFDEIIATSIFLWRRWKAGRPFWKIFFVGDSDEEKPQKEESHAHDLERSAGAIIKDMLSGGVTFPWNLMLCLLIGIWLMFTRITLDATGSMANADHLIGSLIITVTVTALAESVRIVRFINLIFAIALLITPFAYGADALATIASLICGVLLFLLTLPRGKIVSSYGAWEKIIV
ncbi:NAD-dependent epimerase/dehydratase family protein [Legionella israelensis]|uniref:NAD-dependent epimerase/dehydratase family protein n=1 Tax=Legionella israelensis TaxID=454 RepID=A0AAX1EEE1_9GAMM|nr:vitamin K epoxide reductase family protein [Legionella israelensis]QBR83402.1 NAD-dependent epimerase/dehydratase family protein [Legionella israelensis]